MDARGTNDPTDLEDAGDTGDAGDGAGAVGDDDPHVDAGLRASTPPDGYVVVGTWVLEDTTQISGLRAEIQRAVALGADPQPVLGRVARDMVLVASELATNALRHGIPPTIVRLLREDGTFLLDVADHDLGSTPYVAGERPAGHGGFGLQIARRLALDVGWYSSERTKHVWALFPARETVTT